MSLLDAPNRRISFTRRRGPRTMNFPYIEPLEARIAPATITISGISVTEGDSGKTAAVFTVTLSETATEQITVDFSTVDGTATSSGLFPDFEALQGTLTFQAGDTSQQITVQVLGEQIQESSETFTVNLTNPSGTNTIDNGTATGTINADGDTLIGVGISNAASVTEGAGQPSKFTVTLAQALGSTVTVNFATGAATDTAKPAPGAFTDYIAQTGTVTFAPGETTKEISIVLAENDNFLEASEIFTVTLTGATNAAVSGRPTAIGTIVDDGDTVIGIRLPDVQMVEGSSDSTLVIRPTLSGPYSQNLSLTLTTQSGTAVAGSDFSGGTPTPVVIAQGQTTGAFNITIKGDSIFEGTESFFVNLTGVPDGIVIVNDHPIVPSAQITSRVYLFNDDIQALATNKLRWTDVDGDIVTMTLTKGSFFDSLGNLLTGVVSFTDPNAIGGRQLQLLDLVGSSGVSFGSRFAGTNVTITAAPEAGSPLVSNGRVDVGLIQAALFITQELQVIGVDLGVVTIDGDLARISAGDQYSTPAIRTLDVYSLGVNPGSLAPDDNATSTTLRTQSDVLGPIGTLNVKTNVEGFLHVVGAEFGTIGTVKIGGDLKGGAPDSSGRITASGRIGSATIGNIIGGSGSDSGKISGTQETGGKLGNVTVIGDVTGGTGARSGEIFSTSTIGAIKIGGKLAGGTGADSGSIQSGGTVTSLSLGTLVGNTGQGSGSVRVGVNNAGSVIGFGNIGAVTITGKDASNDSIKGGTGVNSGRIDVSGSIASLTVAGDIVGNSGSGSGAIANRSTIGAIKIAGSLVGGTGANSGSIESGGNVTSLSVSTLEGNSGTGSGSVRVGVNNTSTAIASFGNIGAVNITGKTATGEDSILGGTGTNSGRIDVLGSILSLTVAGDIQGGTGTGAGNGAVASRSTIGAIKIGGNITGTAGENSGSIQSGEKVTSLSANYLVGGAGKGSGAIRVGVDNSGIVFFNGSMGAVTFLAKNGNDSILGGSGVHSGKLDVGGSIASITVNGDVRGGSGSGSGSIVAGANIDKLLISGSLRGADTNTANLITSGAIKASWLKSATITGDIVAGKKTGTGTITSSGAILANKIDLLKVDGKLTGDASNPVFINATGLLGDLAIKSLTVGGTVEFATIRAGYSDTAATSADASIGNVVFSNTVHGLNLVAGAQAGTDGRFGTADDLVVTGTVKNVSGIVSKIASVIFTNAQPIIADASGYGIVAQHIAAITVGTTKVPQAAGPGNDRTPIELAPATQFRAVELAVP